MFSISDIFFPGQLPRLRENALCLSQQAFSNFVLHVVNLIIAILTGRNMSLKSFFENLDFILIIKLSRTYGSIIHLVEAFTFPG